MQVDHAGISRIRNALKFRPKGMSISEIAHQLRMNRNSVAKYLEILLIAGEVEVTPHGASRVYTLSQRVPASAMMRFSTDMIVLVGPEGHVLQVNEPFLSFFSLSREEVAGQPVSGIKDTALRGLLERTIPGEGESARGEVTECTILRDGKEAFIRVKGLPTVFDDGTEGTTVIIEDQTARHMAENTLAERETLYRSVIDNIQDAFYRSDDQGRLILASPSFARMLGYDSVEDCLGKDIRETFYINPTDRDTFVHMLEENGPVREYELLLKKKDGSPLYALTNTHLYFGPDGHASGTEGIFRDNTERRMYDRLLHQATVDLQTVSRTATEFLELPDDADLFAAIATGLESLIPGSVVFVSSFHPGFGLTKLEHTAGPGGRSLHFQPSTPGTNRAGLSSEVDIRIYPLIRSGQYHEVPLSVPDLLVPRLTGEAWSAIQEEDTFSSGGIIGFILGDQLLGCATILIPSAGEPVKDVLVEAYARLASFALQKRAAEVILRELETRLSASEEKLRGSLDDIEFLSSKTKDFLALPPGDAIYHRIATDIHSIVPAAMVLVNSYDRESGFITAMSIQDDGKRDICTRILGSDPIHRRAPINTATLSSLRAGNIFRVSLPLYEVFLHAVPQEPCERLMHEMPVGEIYAIGFTKGDELYGNATIFLPGDAEGVNLPLIEAYGRSASIALQRAAAEASLLQSEALFSGIAEHSPVPITVIGDNGSCIYANPAFRDLFGYDLRDLPSLREWSLIAFPDTGSREEAMREWDSISRGRTPPASGSFTARVRCRDGVPREIRFRIAPLAHGGYCVLYEDITLPIQAERYRQILSFLVESTGDAVIGMNTGGFILSWNRAAEEIYGFSRQEAVGQHILLIVPPDRRYEYDEIMGTVLSGEVISGLRTRRVAKDGTYHNVEVTVSPIRDSTGSIIGASTIVRKDDGKENELVSRNRKRATR